MKPHPPLGKPRSRVRLSDAVALLGLVTFWLVLVALVAWGVATVWEAVWPG